MSYEEPWLNFHNPLIRQLAFVIASPNLIHFFPEEIKLDQKIHLYTHGTWNNFLTNYQQRLLYLDQHPEELVEFLVQIKSTRLGLRFEGLLWFWLQDTDNKDFNLIGHSIQTHHQGKTIGEIDFLIQNLRTFEIEHWEVCLKYYLAEPDLNIASWIGLNPDDTFMHKLNHIVHHQFQFKNSLGHHIQKRVAVIKGQLFLPQHHIELPLWINQERRLGSWNTLTPESKGWRRLNRQEWLCKFEFNSNPENLHWWTNGLYYHEINDEYFMFKLNWPNYIFI